MLHGSVLPIQRAEELLATLPGVISARIVAGANGAVEEIHILTSDEISPKQTVRNVESALIAHLGMRVSHKKISVATSSHDAHKVSKEPEVVHLVPNAGAKDATKSAPSAFGLGAQLSTSRPSANQSAGSQQSASQAPASSQQSQAPSTSQPHITPSESFPAWSTDQNPNTRRRLYFEDVEVRRSRTKGVACRVTLRKGDQSYIGEAEGMENERLRIELAARATLSAISQAEGDARVLGLEGVKSIEAFDRQFVFVGVTTRAGREHALLTGSAEIKESPETASVLAVLDATNRWIEYAK
jgi:hypothetical protein